MVHTLRSLIEGGGWNSRGAWKKYQKLLVGGVELVGGVGKNWKF